jgi:hypothetical protein
MKRVAWFVMVALLAIVVLSFAAGCGSKVATSSSDTVSDSPTTEGSGTSESSPPSSEGETKPADSPVFAPHELLSAEEASEISGFVVAMDEGSLSEDQASGTISERYAYDLDGTGIHALVEIHQDSLKASAADEGVLADFSLNQDLLKDEITAVDLGEQAFTLNGTGQLHMYYEGYYIVVAFDADPYSSEQNAPLNIKLGERILANLQAALQ